MSVNSMESWFCSVCGCEDVERVSMVSWFCPGCDDTVGIRNVGRLVDECVVCGRSVLGSEGREDGGMVCEHDLDGDDFCVVNGDGEVVDSGRRVGVAFDGALVDGVLSGEKDVTFRYGFDKVLGEGSVFGVYDADKRYRVADARVVDVYELTVGEVVEREWEGHREYESVDECLDVFAQYYPDESLGVDSVFTVLEFEVIREVAACERS